MNTPFGNLFCLGSLPYLASVKSRSISAENPTGEKGGGAKAVPEPGSAAELLGTGWKVRPCLHGLAPGSVTPLAEIDGPGQITHIWITTQTDHFRSCVLRMYWDGEPTPSVEVPLGDFFCNGHGRGCDVNALPISVNPERGLNCYFPMPFRTHAKITIENQRWEPIRSLFYQVDYQLGEVPADAAYFHAQFRIGMTTRQCPERVLVDGVKGVGQYVGCYVAWCQFSNGWWGEGEMKYYLDGDTEHPTICTTGTEDVFGGAWGFGGRTYSTPFLGYPLRIKEDGKVPMHGLYRFYVLDPIRFDRDFKATLQALGWWLDRKFEPLTDEIASTTYWYQREPHAAFPALPDLPARHPR
jgi:hypothetical protein